MSKTILAEQPDRQQHLTRQDLANRWRCSIETIKRREKAKVLTGLKLGRSVRYRLNDILAIEEKAAI